MSTLIVPIDVTALTVGVPDTSGSLTLAPMANFTKLPSPGGPAGAYMAAEVVAQGQAFAGEVPFVAGIHLHWALPDALTQGQTTAGQLAFPAVPNRWLVSRILQDTSRTGQPAAVTSWVVESDRLSNDPDPNLPSGLNQPTVPLTPMASPNSQYLGARFPLASWSETTASRLAPLNALGYGETSFASFYPNCATVFGFVDTLADVPAYNAATSTLTYQVSGWYATLTDDPLNPATTNPVDTAAFWSFSGAPVATLLCGTAAGISYDPGTAYLAATTPGKQQVAVGSSQAEALSALMASVLEGAEFAGAQTLLNALQFGLLTATGEVDSLPVFEQDVQAAGFASLPAGTLWSITLPGGSAASHATGDLPAEVTLPVPLAEALNTLNSLQTAYDKQTQALTAAQWQLFADWYKYLVVAYMASTLPATMQGLLQQVVAYLTTEAEAIDQASQTSIPAALAAVTAQQAVVQALTPSPFQLTAGSAPTYFQPHDPVLVLAGDNVTPIGRYGNDGADSPDGLLACRTDDMLVTAEMLAAGLVAGSDAVTVTGADLPALAAIPAVAVGSLLQPLMQEAFFLDQTLVPSLAAGVLAVPAAQNPMSLDAAATTAALIAANKALWAGTATGQITFTGMLPAAVGFVTAGALPWLPLFLQYTMEFYPVQYLVPENGGNGYQGGFITGNFAIEADGFDFSYVGAPLDAGQLQLYSGSVILTNRASNDLAAAISAFIAVNPDQELSDILSSVQGMLQLSQGLDGLTLAMLMRQVSLQMPVANPFAGFEAGFVNSVAQAIAGQTMITPLPQNAFNPIRAGGFSLTRLRLVDVFGRYLDLTDFTTVAAQGLLPPPALTSGACAGFLPPRINQPARLLFDWVSAADREIETSSHPATSPVIAIIVPNYLDRSLAIYTAAGTPLIVFTLAADGSSVDYTAAPGGTLPLATPISQIVTGQNADLGLFVTAMLNNGPAFFAALLDNVQAALTGMLPAAYRQSAGLAMLTGQALVLARGALGLDLAGPPATDESWTSFAATVQGGTPNAQGWGQVAFPVLLGGINQLNDTLVGYFLEPGAQTDYAQFYMPAVSAAGGGVQAQTMETLTLLPSTTGEPATTVMMLLDPRGPVNATSGILPVQQVQIPQDQYAAALAGLSISLSARPLLSGSNVTAPQLTMPQGAGNGSWGWTTASGGNWVTTPIAAPANAQAALNYSPQQIADGWLTLSNGET